MSTPAVVVVGSYVQDLSWRCAAFPSPGQTTLGEFATGPGGKGSNQAVAAGRAGARTLFAGAVGRDGFADVARAFYQEEGIAARFATKAGYATGTAAILVDASGQNEIVVSLGANAALAARDLRAAMFRGARVVVVQLEANLGAAAHALRAGRRAGASTVLNPAPMRSDFDPELLKLVDVLVPNETEFVALVNRLGIAPGGESWTEAELAAARPDAVHALCRRMGPPVVIVTLGRRGCLISRPEGVTMRPAHTVRAVDTTGAGDAFVGGLAAGLARHPADLDAAVELAQIVAALSVTKRGTAPAMPTEKEIAAFRRQLAVAARSRSKTR